MPKSAGCGVSSAEKNTSAPPTMAFSKIAGLDAGDGLNVVYGDTSGTYDVSQLRNVAAVMVTAELPAFAASGSFVASGALAGSVAA